jgi:hypothetical protein
VEPEDSLSFSEDSAIKLDEFSQNSQLWHPLSVRFVLILSSHLRLRLSSGFFLLGFMTEILYALLMPTDMTAIYNHA